VYKQLVVAINNNKIDAQPWDMLESDRKAIVEQLMEESGSNTSMMMMSNISKEGASQVNNHACDKLFAARIDSRASGNKVNSMMNRLQMVYTKVRDGVVRDGVVREVCIRSGEYY